MAGILLIAKPSPITLISTETHTLLQIKAASNHRAIIKRLAISMNGVTAADAPVLFELCVQSSTGTMTSLTLVHKNSLDTETIQTTAQHTATSEPTTGNLLWGDYFHEQSGGELELHDIVVPGGTYVGLRYTAGTLTGTVKCQPVAEIEE